MKLKWRIFTIYHLHAGARPSFVLLGDDENEEHGANKVNTIGTLLLLQSSRRVPLRAASQLPSFYARVYFIATRIIHEILADDAAPLPVDLICSECSTRLSVTGVHRSFSLRV